MGDGRMDSCMVLKQNHPPPPRLFQTTDAGPLSSSRHRRRSSSILSSLRSTSVYSSYPRAHRFLRGGGAGDELDDLRRDLRLPLAVVLERQTLGEVLRVVGRVRHRVHARRELGRERLLKRAKNLRVHVQRQKRVENLVRVLLKLHHAFEPRDFRLNRLALDGKLPILRREREDDIVLRVHARAVDVANLTLLGQRQKRLDRRVAVDQRHEARVHELNFVNLLADKLRVHLVRDRLRLLRLRRLAHVERLHEVVLVLAALEVHGALLADGHELRRDALRLELRDALLRLLDDEVVEPAAQAAVAGAHEQQHSLHRADVAQRHVHVLAREAGVDGEEHLHERLGERTRVDDGILRAAHLWGGVERRQLELKGNAGGD
eukprot:31328-Pelagococcus_subviridis.AAC.3